MCLRALIFQSNDNNNPVSKLSLCTGQTYETMVRVLTSIFPQVSLNNIRFYSMPKLAIKCLPTWIWPGLFGSFDIDKYGVPFYFLFPIYGYPKFIFGYP